MSKYDAHEDPYLNPVSGVLYNLHGIDDEDMLEAVEADFTAGRAYQLREKPLQGDFDLKHLQAIHRYMFQDTYAWAGEIRTLDISKGADRFCNFKHIESEMAKITAKLAADDHLLGLQPTDFADKAAHYFADINAVHPFREGNGRAQREFINHLAANAGYVVAWENAPPVELLNCTIEAHHRSEKPLAALIARHLTKR